MDSAIQNPFFKEYVVTLLALCCHIPIKTAAKFCLQY